ncbi:MAG: dienelactone hydrolase family protein [Gammaproteobacteria bacterium]|nr:dienelactone hydrolase family protein [Gammaproteobacteria bacterium]MDE2250940.1 dienelactone hydrolase family protein [Gammaproteobacteria bacterium]
MTQPPLATVEVETAANPTRAVIWLHGLGADGHDFEPAVPHLVRPGMPPLRFVFPHAPVRPVTLNGGLPMRAWYDIAALQRRAAQDEAGIRLADAAIRALISRENARGIATQHIVLAGFSQGGALALFTGTRLPEKLAGVVGLSCYNLLAERFSAERHAANQQTPFLLAHGTQDAVVLPGMGEEARAQLVAAGYPVEWHNYPMGHAVCAEELAVIAAFLARVL